MGNQEEDDDDLWWWRGVQGFHRLCYADHEERGLHEHDEGCWCQRSPWCRWCWCARRFRQVPGHVHRGEPASKKCSTSTTTDSHSCDLQLHAKINTSYCRWFRLYKQLLKSIVNVSDCSYIKIKL